MSEEQKRRLPSSAVRMKVVSEGGEGVVVRVQPRGWQNYREGRSEGGREGGSEGVREGVREGGREGRRE